MPNTLPHQPDLIDGDGSVAVDTVADSIGKSTIQTCSNQTFGSNAEHAAGRAEPPSIIRRLTILVIVTILPVLAFSIFAIMTYARDQRTQYEQQLMATAHATTLAIDSVLSRQLVLLKALRNSRELRDGDLRAFYDLAKSVIADQPDARITLYDTSGHVLFLTSVPFGENGLMTGSPEAIHNVMTTKQPYITDLYLGGASKQYAIGTFVPIIENGSVVNVFSLAGSPDFVSQILRSEIQTIGGVGAVFDRNNKLVGRSKNEDVFIGQSAVPAYRDALQKSDQGSLEGRNLEGLPVYAVYVKSALSGLSLPLIFNAI